MAGQPPTKPTHLEPSPLGTKEYWDSLYTRELHNHAADPHDVGTIWFDDSSAEDKLVAFLQDRALGLDLATASFLDAGTGNGHLLFRLREEEYDDDEGDDDDEDGAGAGDGGPKREGRVFRGRMLGTDYSRQSIDFARRIAADKGFGGGADADAAAAVEFAEWDILSSAAGAVLSGANADGWDVVLDKGTFDAISLSSEVDGRGRRIVEGYKERIVPVMRAGGLLVVTSCNWTEEELRGWFEDREMGPGETGLRFERRIEYRSFSFGGKKGQTISSCCFRKVRI